MTDLLTALREDEEEILDLLRRLAPETDPERRRVLFDEVGTALRQRLAFERQELYPLACHTAADGSRQRLEDEIARRAGMEAVLDRMEEEPVASARWQRHCRRLCALMESHPPVADGILAAGAVAALGQAEAARLADRFETDWKV